eukprot:246782_1
MGLATSKRNKKDKFFDHDCECALYAKYNHCCKIECVGSAKLMEQTRKELTNALKQYHLDYIVNIILDYLPCLKVVRFQNRNVSNEDNTNYQVFVHSVTAEIFPRLPCSIWRQSRAGGVVNAGIKLQCMMLGLQGVGKSTLILRYYTSQFFDECDPTIEDSYRIQRDVRGQRVLLDTAGTEDFMSMQDQYMREGKMFFICFAIDSDRSYDETVLQRERILRNKSDCDDYGMILVATKCDLLYDDEWIEQNKKEKHPRTFVNRQMVIHQAKQWNIPYIETSAKSNVNVPAVFEYALYEWWIQSQAQMHSFENI